jgi:hypothetical protein
MLSLPIESTVDDGGWRTLDSRALFRATVALSEPIRDC